MMKKNVSDSVGERKESSPARETVTVSSVLAQATLGCTVATKPSTEKYSFISVGSCGYFAVQAHDGSHLQHDRGRLTWNSDFRVASTETQSYLWVQDSWGRVMGVGEETWGWWVEEQGALALSTQSKDLIRAPYSVWSLGSSWLRFVNFLWRNSKALGTGAFVMGAISITASIAYPPCAAVCLPLGVILIKAGFLLFAIDHATTFAVDLAQSTATTVNKVSLDIFVTF